MLLSAALLDMSWHMLGASAPLQELAAAAEDLGDDLQRDPLPLRGPREVQRAAHPDWFNAPVPTFGTPEPSLVSYGAAQLARRLGLPLVAIPTIAATRWEM